MEQDLSYYYIHRHISHFEKDAAVAAFQEQKRQGYTEARNRYKKNYLESVSINNDSLAMLNAAMSEDEIVSALDEAFLDTLNKSTNDIQATNLDQMLTKAYNSLNDYVNTNESKNLDKMFQQITKATKLLQSNYKGLAILLGKNGAYKKGGLNKLSEAIQIEINSWNGKTIGEQDKRLISILNSLNSIANNLTAGKEINKASLQKSLTNIFSTQIGEYVVSKGAAKALGIGMGEVRKSLTGTKEVKYTEDEKINNFINNYANEKRTFKTDNSFQEINLQIDELDTEVKVNLGLSTKWYKNMGTVRGYGVAIQGQEHGISRRIDQMFDIIERYYAYNAIGLLHQDNEPYKAMKAAIVARNIDVFISGLGMQGDFSQYLVINGEFYSIWQIIQLLELYNAGAGSTDRGSSNDIITISANGASKIASETDQANNYLPNRFEALKRSRRQNQEIKDLKLTGYFYPNKFKSLL